MRRLYSHYTFIYPNRYLKNCVVELDAENRIKRYFPFCKEVAQTEFYSGLIVFMPHNALVKESEFYSCFENYRFLELEEVIFEDDFIFDISFRNIYE